MNALWTLKLDIGILKLDENKKSEKLKISKNDRLARQVINVMMINLLMR